MSLGTGSPIRHLGAAICFSAALFLGWCCTESPVQGQGQGKPPGVAAGQGTSSSTPPLSAAQRKVAEQRARAAAGRPGEAFQGWDKPAIVLVLTGEQQGYLEPCGCTENQAGGLARRMDLFHQMWQRGWSTMAVDVGGNLNKDRLTRDQAKLKLDFFRKASQMMKYKAWGLGIEELKLTADNLFALHSEWSVEEGYVPFVSANVTIFGSRDIGMPKEFQIVDAGGVRFGITSIVGKSDPHPDNGVNRIPEFAGVDPNLLKIDPPESVLPGVIQKMKAQGAQILILLAHAGEEESKALAPGFDIVVTASGPEDPVRKEQRVGTTLYVEPGMKGKHAPCVAIYNRGGKPVVGAFELVELDRDRFKNAPEMTQLMRDYQQRIEMERPDSAHEMPFDSAQRDLKFVGVDQCKDCHKQAFEVWKNTRHAFATQSLSHGRADEPKEYVVDRQFDPECVACHATGWHPQRAVRLTSGFVDLKTTPELAGQQCENCHGPGSAHVTLERAFAKDKKVTKELTASREALMNTRDCEDCHDHDNSPHFDFDKYWNGEDGRTPVKHYGKN
ncbi:Cytochrome c-554 precursor [Caulifigura coniformis]|uniref:Cytochrome c-554 n=1 Tax=Caulifigura coniformis TaxID=2527983 RepID=A0A517SM59_9PLAN|nr:multiheme c-type cytochrome [Caulifigura coniformis]QDT57202.1 Cytochrome c-554 precursor [Caulifigura coniformis]